MTVNGSLLPAISTTEVQHLQQRLDELSETNTRLNQRMAGLEAVVYVLVGALLGLIVLPVIWVMITAVVALLLFAYFPWKMLPASKTYTQTKIINPVRADLRLAKEFYTRTGIFRE